MNLKALPVEMSRKMRSYSFSTASAQMWNQKQ
jgi:hypothetical protein